MASGDGKFASEQSAPGYYGSAQLDDQAARLRSLEGNYSDLNAQLAANTVQLESVNEGVSGLSERIGELHAAITASITTSIPALSRDVEALKSIEVARIAKRDKRRGFVGRWVQGALIAITAASATKFLPFIWTHYLR